jgi:fumarylacetoacetase
MSITANDTKRKSLEVPENSDFPIQNIFGVFLTKENVVTVGTRIGDLL